MDSPSTKLRLDARNINLYQAANYQASPTHSRPYQASPTHSRTPSRLYPQCLLDSGSIDYFSEPSLPPTGLLSPRKQHEIYDTTGLSFQEVTGSPGRFAQMIQSPVRMVQNVSPFQSPVRPTPVSPYHSPMKSGFQKIENSPLINVTMTDNPDWSRLAQPIRPRTELRFTPQKSQPMRTVLYHDSVGGSATPCGSPVQSPCKLASPRVHKLQTAFKQPDLDAITPRKTYPRSLVGEQADGNLDFLLQKLSEEDALEAVQPLLDENQNLLPRDLVDAGPSLLPTTSKMTSRIPSPSTDVTSVLVSGSDAFESTMDEIDVDDVDVEGDVDVDVLIGDGDINITLSSWNEEPHDENVELSCDICAKTFRRRSALSFHQCLHNGGDSASNSPPSRPSSRPSPFDMVDGLTFLKPTKPMKMKFPEIKNPIMPPPKRERSFLCEHCGERFPSISMRASHLNLCDKNSQTFPASLLKYLGTADDGRLMCTVCRKVFNHKSTLKTHIRVHTGEKPCKCRFCGKYYRDHSTLSKHYRVHTNEKPYKCSECMRCFSQSGNMRRHMIHVHKIALPPDAASLRVDVPNSPRKRPRDLMS